MIARCPKEVCRHFGAFDPALAASPSGCTCPGQVCPPERSEKMVFKNIPYLPCRCQEASSFIRPFMVRRIRCLWAVPKVLLSAETHRAQLPTARFSPLMITIKRSRMLNIHHKSCWFAQKIEPGVFSALPGSFLQNKMMRRDISFLLTTQGRKVKKKSSCKLP